MQTVVHYQGKGTGRPIYEVNYKGSTQRVAVTVGSNGYIVGANPQKGDNEYAKENSYYVRLSLLSCLAL